MCPRQCLGSSFPLFFFITQALSIFSTHLPTPKLSQPHRCYFLALLHQNTALSGFKQATCVVLRVWGGKFKVRARDRGICWLPAVATGAQLSATSLRPTPPRSHGCHPASSSSSKDTSRVRSGPLSWALVFLTWSRLQRPYFQIRSIFQRD